MKTHFRELLADERLEKALASKMVALGAADARAEAERCLYCADAPCVRACPTAIDVPTFIRKIATGNDRGSARTIFEQNILGYSCSRVCPVEVLCEGACVYTAWGKTPIAIGQLQRFATESALAPGAEPFFVPAAPSGKRVALVGAGPASLACAAYLALDGHATVVMDKRSLPGGLNTTGVAPYKLHVEDTLREIEWLSQLGVAFELGVEVGRNVTGDELLRAYDAVYLGVGLGEDGTLGVPGEDGPNVIGAIDWIARLKLEPNLEGPASFRPRRVVVIGGGNTAVDAARDCLALGATHVTLAYRRTASQLKGYRHELDRALRSGLRVQENLQPIEFLRDARGALTHVRCSRTVGPPTTAGAPREIVDLPCELALVAIGQGKLVSLIEGFPGVELDDRGLVKVDPTTGATGNPRVYSGGDCVFGAKEVVNAVAAGRDTARHLNALWRAERAHA